MNHEAKPRLFSRITHSYGRIIGVLILCALVLVIYYFTTHNPAALPLYSHQQAYEGYHSTAVSYRVMVVADMDTDSKLNGEAKWKSVIKEGTITRDASGTYDVSWDTEYEVESKYNEGLRGMELSEVVFFNNMLLTCDDRTGIVFQLDRATKKVYPLNVFSGNAGKEKGFKCEWMTVKDDELYIGSIGKEWTSLKGEFINDDPLWVHVIGANGSYRTESWAAHFNKINEIAGIKSSKEGYMVHEAINWDPHGRQWVFLPRRVSVGDPYDAEKEGEKGSNLGFLVSADFSHVTSFKVGEDIPTHGFSSFKFIPWRKGEVAL